MPLLDIKTRAARLLGKTVATIDTDTLNEQVDLTVALLLDYFTDVGLYADLAGTDLLFFDWGAAYLVAADLYEPITRASAAVSEGGGTVTKVKQRDLEYTYSDPSSTSTVFGTDTPAVRYARKGYELLRRVDAIGYTTPLDTYGVTLTIIPTSTLSPLPFESPDDWAAIRGLS